MYMHYCKNVLAKATYLRMWAPEQYSNWLQTWLHAILLHLSRYYILKFYSMVFYSIIIKYGRT